MSTTKVKPDSNGKGRPPKGMVSIPVIEEPGDIIRAHAVFTGRTPLLMHAPGATDPEDPVAERLRTLTKKRGELPDAERDEKYRLEFLCGLYHDDDIGPFVQAAAIRRGLVDAGRAYNLGKAVAEGLFLDEERVPVLYDGPRDALDLWETGFHDSRLIRNSGRNEGRVLRVRPCFEEWELRFGFTFDNRVLDAPKVARVMARAKNLGIGDGRVYNGRPGIGMGLFNVEMWVEK